MDRDHHVGSVSSFPGMQLAVRPWVPLLPPYVGLKVSAHRGSLTTSHTRVWEGSGEFWPHVRAGRAAHRWSGWRGGGAAGKAVPNTHLHLLCCQPDSHSYLHLYPLTWGPASTAAPSDVWGWNHLCSVFMSCHIFICSPSFRDMRTTTCWWPLFTGWDVSVTFFKKKKAFLI